MRQGPTSGLLYHASNLQIMPHVLSVTKVSLWVYRCDNQQTMTRPFQASERHPHAILNPLKIKTAHDTIQYLFKLNQLLK